MASRAGLASARQVKPILSVDRAQARRRVINLYKAWYREIPLTVHKMGAPISVAEGRKKVREMFEKNKNITDIRVIDMLVIKGQLDLHEISSKWSQCCHFMNFFKETYEPKPTDFMSKFYGGQP